MSGLLLVTLISMLLAVVMSAIAWRVSRDERRRTDARIDSLAADIHDAVEQAAVAAQPMPRRVVAGLRGETAPIRSIRPAMATSSDLFAVSDPASAGSRSIVVVGVGLFVFATVAALAVVFSSGWRATALPPATAPAATHAATATPPNATRQAPLELVALGQERDGDHLIVRGVIRNPSNGTRVDRLVAVAFLFDRDGGFLTSGRATIDNATLVAGGESAFLVNVPGAANVARYRVSFRTETAVVPHLDKRHVP